MGLSLPNLGKNIWDAITGDVGGVVQGAEHLFGINQPQNHPAPAPSVVPQINQAAGFRPFIQAAQAQASMPPPPGMGPSPIPPPAKPKVAIKRNPVVDAVNAILNPGSMVNPASQNPIARGVAQGVANSAAGFGVPAVVGAGEVFNRDINAPIQAALASGGQLVTGRPVTWSKNYNQAADTLTNSVSQGAKLLDKATGTSIAPQVESAYEHPKTTAAMTALTALGPTLAVAPKAVQAALGLGFGGYGASQVPSEVQTVQQAQTPQEKAAAITGLVANIAASGTAAGIGVHGVVKGVKDAVIPSNTVKLAGAKLATEDVPETTPPKVTPAETPTKPVVKATTLETPQAGAAKALQSNLIRTGTEGMTPEQVQLTKEVIARQGVPPPGADPFGVRSFAVDKEADVPRPYKAEGTAVKATSDINRLSKLGASGREALQRVNNVERETAVEIQAMKDAVPTFYKLSKAEQREAFDVREGSVTTNNPKVTQAVSELNDFFPKALETARQAGANAGDLGENYMPHVYPKGFFKKPENFQAAVKELVESGKAPDEATAIQMLNEVKSGRYLGGRRFGNVDMSRVSNAPGYLKDSSALDHYIEGLARRSVEARHFGPNGEVAQGLVNRAQKSGYDGKALSDILARYLNPEFKGGAVAKAASGVRKTLAVVQLQKAALKHIPQGLANIGSEIGFGRYIKAVARKVFNSADREYARKAGFHSEKDFNHSGVGRATAPGLKQVRQFHRDTAAIGGKYLAEGLAKRGDEAGLRRWGVTGDLERDANGRIQLNDSQKYQVSHTLSDKTIFSNNPLQSPAWAQQNLGKFIGQYRTAYTFKQAGFINGLFKQAAQGRPAPLLRYLGVAVPVAGATATGLVSLYTGKGPKDAKDLIQKVVSNSGAGSIGGGIPESVLNTAQHSYNVPSLIGNVAGDVIPAAGTAVQTGMNVASAVGGNSKPLVKEGLSYVPGGGMVSTKLFPPTPADVIAYANGRQQTLDSAANATEKDALNAYFDRNRDQDGRLIQLSPAQSVADAKELYANRGALNKLQQFEQGLAQQGQAVDPKWNLSPDQLRIFEQYQAMGQGGSWAQRTALSNTNPFIGQTIQQEQDFFNSLTSKGQSTPWSPTPDDLNQLSKWGFSGDDLAYPKPPANIQGLLDTYNNSSTPAATKSAILNGPNGQAVIQAMAQFGRYSNARGVLEGNLPDKAFPVPSPAVRAGFNDYNAWVAKGGSKKAWITGHAGLWGQMQDAMTASSLYELERQGALAQIQGQPVTQSFLKSAYDLGTYDIGKNAAGQYTLAQGGKLPAGFKSGGSSGFTKRPRKVSGRGLVTGVKRVHLSKLHPMSRYGMAKVAFSPKLPIDYRRKRAKVTLKVK